MTSAAVAVVLGAARPEAAWALLLPLVFLLALRLLARPPERVIGTLELWRELAPAEARGARARGSFPPWALATALGLLCGALAWLGPRGARAAAPRAWTCVVDRSPSMGLALAPLEATTRQERALGLAEEVLAHAAARDARVRWRAADRPALELARGERPPRAWLAPAEGGGEPDWASQDIAGALWITDAAPRVERRHAGLCASGGAAVEGAIAGDGRTTVRWEGGALVEGPSPERSAVLVRAPAGCALPEVLERVLAAWCEARGFELLHAPGAGELRIVLLVELRATAASSATFALERDGWRATARGARLPEDEHPESSSTESAGDEDWLVAAGIGTVLRARLGKLEVGLTELSEPKGDPAAFALSFGQLFDRCARPVAGVVPLAERVAAGEPTVLPGESAPPAAEPGADLGPFVDAGLALAAALCAGLACLLRVHV